MSTKKFTAFISYAHSDAEQLAGELLQKINADPKGKEITFWQDHSQMKYGQWSKQIEDAIDAVQFLIMIITPGALASSNCKDEWIYARKKGVPVLPVSGKPDDKAFYETFPTWLTKQHIYHPQKNWEQFIGALNNPPAVLRIPFMAPKLREITNYVERPGKLKRVKEMLLNTGGNPVSITTALQGSGGFGKTALAIALCNDDTIISEFDDGILWVTLGQQKGTALTALQKLYDAISTDKKSFIDTEQAQQHLKEKLHAKKCLVVLDDVWHRYDAEEIIRALDQSTVLITTRIDKLLLTARQAAVDEMTVEESVQTLAGLCSMAHFPPKALETLAGKLGNWPLLLKLAAAQLYARVTEGETGEEALAYVNKKLQKKGLTALDLNDAGKRSDSVKSCLEASIDLFDTAQKDQLFSLGIFPEDENIPFAVIEKLWALDDFDTEELLQKFHRDALLDIDLPRKTVSMHDILLKYYHDKLGNNYSLIQQQFIGQLGPYTSWAEKNIYHWTWYAWHIKESTSDADAFHFLTDYAWIRGKLHATSNTYEVAKDFLFVSGQEDMQLIYKALLLSALVVNTDPVQLPHQLYGRLGTLENVACKKLALEAEEAIKQIDCGMRPIVPLLEIPELKNIVFKGHTGSVNGAILVDDQLISWSKDKTLRSWDLASGKSIHEFTGHTGFVAGALLWRERLISWANDGEMWSIDRMLRSWDIASGELIHEFKGHKGHVTGALLCKDQLISWSDDNTLISWDVASGELMNQFTGHTRRITKVVFSGNQLVSGSNDETLRSWDVGSGKLIHEFTGHADGINGLILFGDQLISWSYNGTLRSWNVDSGELIHEFKGHTGWLQNGTLLSGDQLISWSDDNTLRSWDVINGKPIHEFKGHKSSVNGALLSGDQLISWSGDRTARSWDLVSGELIHEFKGHAEWVNGAVLCGDQLVSWSDDKTVRSWDLITGELIHEFKGHIDRVKGALLWKSQLISWSDDKTLRSWDLSKGKAIEEFTGHTDGVAGTLLWKDQLISWSGDKTLRSWGIGSGKPHHEFKGHTESVSGALLWEDQLISWSDDKTLRSWDIGSGKLIHEFKGHTASVTGALLCSDQLISWSYDETLSSWDINSGKRIHKFEGQINTINGALLSGDQLISWSDDGALRSWDVKSGKAIHEFKNISRVTEALFFGDQLISLSDDGALRSWDVASGELIYKFKSHRDIINGVVLSGDRLISWSYDGTLSSWDIGSGEVIHEFKGHKGWIKGALLSDGQLISWKANMSLWSDDGALRSWDISTGMEINKLNFFVKDVQNHNGLLYLIDNLNSILIYSFPKLEKVCQYTVDAEITTLQVVPEHNKIILGDASGRVHFLEPIGFKI